MKNTLPREACEAKNFIIGMLRKNMPNGFMAQADRDLIPPMPMRMRSLLSRMARQFPAALNLIDMDGRAPLHWVARLQCPELIEEFLLLGADPFLGGLLPLAEAAEFSHGPSLEILARATGVDAIVCPVPKGEASRSSNILCGASALVVAAMTCNGRAIKTLLNMGANPMAQTNLGLTALHMLCFYPKAFERAWPCAKMLIDAEPRLVLARDAGGSLACQTALRHANPLAAPLMALEEKDALDSGLARAEGRRLASRL